MWATPQPRLDWATEVHLDKASSILITATNQQPHARLTPTRYQAQYVVPFEVVTNAIRCRCRATAWSPRAPKGCTKLVTALQLAAHQTATVARDEAMKPTGRTRSTGTQAQKGPGGRREVPPGTAWGSPAKHAMHPCNVQAESVVSAEAGAKPGKATWAASGSPERSPNDQENPQAGCREGNQALQRAVTTQRVGEIRHREEAGRNRRGVEQQ